MPIRGLYIHEKDHKQFEIFCSLAEKDILNVLRQIVTFVIFQQCFSVNNLSIQ